MLLALYTAAMQTPVSPLSTAHPPLPPPLDQNQDQNQNPQPPAKLEPPAPLSPKSHPLPPPAPSQSHSHSKSQDQTQKQATPKMQADQRPGVGVYIPPPYLPAGAYNPGMHHAQFPYTPISADGTPSSISASLGMARPSDSSSHHSFAHSHSSASVSQPHSATHSPYQMTNRRPSLGAESGHQSSTERMGGYAMGHPAADDSEGSENREHSYDGHDAEGKPGESSTGEKRKKPRITLARGGACVACRNRKL